MNFKFIAVEGPIGVGKTSLVDLLAERFDAARVLEKVENPFLHSGEHEGGHGAGAGEHAATDGVTRSAFIRDSARKLADRGYALSLRVLGAISV